MTKPYRSFAAMRHRSAVGGAMLAGCLAVASVGFVAPSSAGAASASASPITIMTATPIATAGITEAQQEAAGNAAVKLINAAGGVNGHPLKLVICNTQFTSDGETACARQAATTKVAAVVGGLATYPGFFSTLLSEKIPYIGGLGLTAPEMADPNSYPLTGGNYAWYYGAAAFALQRGSKHPGFLTCPTPACIESQSYFIKGMKIAGVTDVKTVSIPETATNYNAAAAQVTAGGTDSVTIVGNPSQIVQQITALRQAGYTGPIYATDGQLAPPIIKTLGATLSKNVYPVSLVLPTSQTSNKEVATFTKATLAQTPKASLTSTALTEWGAVYLFAGAADQLHGAITASAMLKQMAHLSTPVNLGGIVPPYSTVGKKSPIPAAPQLYNFTAIFDKIATGAAKPITKAVNPITLLKRLKAKHG